MSIQPIETPSSRTVKRTSKQSYLLAIALTSSTLLAGVSAMPMTTQAAGLGDLFGNNQSAAPSKFLPVDEAFQVSSSSTPTKSGTRLAINFDITPKH